MKFVRGHFTLVARNYLRITRKPMPIKHCGGQRVARVDLSSGNTLWINHNGLLDRFEACPILRIGFPLTSCTLVTRPNHELRLPCFTTLPTYTNIYQWLGKNKSLVVTLNNLHINIGVSITPTFIAVFVRQKPAHLSSKRPRGLVYHVFSAVISWNIIISRKIVGNTFKTADKFCLPASQPK